jgi:hypothetical protein
VEGIEHTGKDGAPLQVAEVDEKAVASIVKRLKEEFVDS